MKRKLTIEEIKQYSLEILKDIKRVCRELNLTYFLDSGTLLGAVRHNGFIPWDDDIDVSMPRPDYEIFIKEYNKHCNPKFRLKCIENSPDYAYPYAKIYNTETILYEYGKNNFDLGLSVDIFTIDAYPNNDEKRTEHYKNVISLFEAYARQASTALNRYSLNPRNIKRNIRIFRARTYLQKKRALKVIENAKSVDWDKSDFAGINVCIFFHPYDRFIPKDCWIPIDHQFEDEEFSIPKGYDSVLKSYYGPNYMTPPPVEKRQSTHGLEIFLR